MKLVIFLIIIEYYNNIKLTVSDKSKKKNVFDKIDFGYYKYNTNNLIINNLIN